MDCKKIKVIYDDARNTTIKNNPDTIGSLAYYIHIAEMYINKKCNTKKSIRIKLVPTMPMLPFLLSKKGNNIDVLCYNNSSIEWLDKNMSIAKAIGAILSELADEPFLSEDEEYIYFAKLLVERYIAMDNGAFLRQEYMAKRISGEFPTITLSEEKEVEIKNKFKEIFVDFAENFISTVILSCEIRLATRYIQEKEYANLGLEAKQLCINVDIWEYMFEPKARARFSVEGAEIFHTSLDELESYLNRTKHNDIHKFSTSNILRFLLAHEIGHTVCHRRPGNADTPINFALPPEEIIKMKDQNKECEEAESTFYARMLLHHSELIYNDNLEDGNYHAACEKWDKLLALLCKDKEWVNQVLKENTGLSSYAVKSLSYQP